MLLQNKFHRKETKVCLIIWISAVLYAIYQFAVASQKYFQDYHDHYEDFTTGWYFLNFHKKDKADFEWETISFFLKVVYPVMLCYVVVSEIGRYLLVNIELQQYFQILFPLLYLTYAMGYKITFIALIQPVLFSLVASFKNKLLIWMCSLFCLALITIYKKISAIEEFLKDLNINHFEAYLNILLLCWMNLKCTSFLLNASKTSLLEYLSYCFYFPTLFTGPFIGYQDFKKLHDIKSFEGLDIRLKKLAQNILRCVFWKLFADFWLHFVYVNSTSFQLELVKRLDLWSLCGYGYLMGQFFHIKYVILYGISTSLASFDNIIVPSLPRCIGRVHLYSDMWKYFDPGLYDFLKKHIFIPSQKLGLGKFGSSFLCFSFVFIWHGIEEYILIWASLNFMGVIVEDEVKTLYLTKLKHANFMKKITGNNLRRLKCAMAAPLLALSALSNFYFFAGKEVGNVFIEKYISEPCFKQVWLIFVLYCCCEISTELRDVNAHKM